MLLDPSIPKQQYVEDCEICCNPIDINLQFEEEILVSFQAINLEQ